MTLPVYSKPFLDVSAQIALMESRGLVVDLPRQEAEEFLASVNYYRFTGYALPFLADRETFKPTSKVSEIIAIYAFDRKLRDLMGGSTICRGGKMTTIAIPILSLNYRHGRRCVRKVRYCSVRRGRFLSNLH